VVFRGTIALLCLIFFFRGIASAEGGKKPGEFQKFASDLRRHFENLGWNDLDTEKLDWEYYRKSRGNKPLTFTTFGKKSGQTVLFLSGIHGDESPPVYILFRLAQFLKENPELYRDKMIIVAPLINPDGFFSKPQKRTNGRGVDINRNFPTKDWKQGKKEDTIRGPMQIVRVRRSFRLP
jgi:protein MpaA